MLTIGTNFGVLPGAQYKVSDWLRGGAIDLGYTNLEDVRYHYGDVQSLDDCAFFWGVRRALAQGDVNVCLPPGDYYTNQVYNNNRPGLYINRSNLNLYAKGATVNVEGTNANGLTLSPYRRGGWKTRSRDVIPVSFKDNTYQKGTSFLYVDAERASALKGGEVVFVRFGARKFDQEQGEFNVVDKVVGEKVFFQKPLTMPYDLVYCNSQTEVSETVVLPKVNDVVSVSLSGDLPKTGSLITISGVTFFVNDVNGNVVTITSVHSFNTGHTVVDAGEKVYASQALVLCGETSANVNINFLSVRSSGDVLNTSNSVDVTMNRCVFERTATEGGGLWWDADGGRGISLNGCVVSSKTPIASQIARSCSDIGITNCDIKNASIGVTEFSRNVNIRGNTIHTKQGVKNGAEFDITPVGIGHTTADIKVHGNSIVGDGTKYGISTNPDIHLSKNLYRGHTSITNNSIDITKAETAINISGAGIRMVAFNQISGDTCYLFSIPNQEFVSEDHPCFVSFTQNSFTGKINAVMASHLLYCSVEKLYINRTGKATIGNTATTNGGGNVVWGRNGQPEPYGNVSFVDVTLVGWEKLPNSINWKGSADDPNVEISNVKFLSF